MTRKHTALILCLALTAALLAPVSCQKDKSDSRPETSSARPGNPDASRPLASAPPASRAQESVSAPMEPDQLPAEKVTWGPGRGTDHGLPPGAAACQREYGARDVLFLRQNHTDRKIALTFDEGYEFGLSGRILDILREKKVHAVFFVTMDFARHNPELIRRMIAEGHAVGNHSTTHPSFPGCSPEKQRREVMTLHNHILKEFGYRMHYFHYPMGKFSRQSLAVLRSLGYTAVFWSFAHRDWVTDDQPDPGKSLKLLTDQLHPGAIYLLHAVSRTDTEILADWIDRARAQGYSFVFPDAA